MINTFETKYNTAIQTLMLIIILVLTGFTIAAHNKATTAEVAYMKLKATMESTFTRQVDMTDAVIKIRKDLHPSIAREWSIAFLAAADEFNLKPKLLIALSQVESGLIHLGPYGYTLTSHKGAEGIMQVMCKYWGHGALPFIKSCNDLRHPTLNIRAGAAILRHYIDMYQGNYLLGITAYNRGERAVDRALKAGRSPYNTYLPKILKRMKLLDLLTV